MAKLQMPQPYIGGTSPESAAYQASDDASVLARAHTVLRNPARVKALQVHIGNLKALLSKKSFVKKSNMPTIGGKR